MFIDFLVFYLGAILGSFSALVAYRLPRGLKISIDRSRCDSCKEELSAKELVPILAYIKQAGTCSYCGNKIRFIYFLFELLSGLLSLTFFKKYGFNKDFIIYTMASYLLLVMASIDREYRIIPNKLNFLFFILALVKSIFDGDILASFIRSGIFLIVTYLINRLTKDAIGMGDIKLLASLGFFFRKSQYLLLIFLSLLTASVYSLFILVFKEREDGLIAFGPFILLAFILTVLLGDRILSAYYLYFKVVRS